MTAIIEEPLYCSDMRGAATFRRRRAPQGLHTAKRHRNRRPLLLERLEDRTLLAAAVIQVDTFDDVLANDGRTSLREAVILANSTPGDVEIRLEPGTYRLSIQGAFESQALSGDLNVLANYLDREVTVLGAGSGQTTIDAGGLGDRIFLVAPGAALHLKHTTLTGGVTPSASGDGGAVLSLGELTVTGSVISGNSASRGGGGIAIRSLGAGSYATLTVTDSTISGNAANGGGGIANESGTVTLITSTVSDNTAAASWGGGILTYSFGLAEPLLTIVDSTLSRNQAVSFGGGIRQSDGVANLDNVVLTGNSAVYGGAISTGGGTLTLTGTTLSDNSAAESGGGIDSDGDLTISHSILSGNQAGEIGGGIDNGGTLTLTDSTVTSNTAGDAGGGVINQQAATMIALNSSFSSNSAVYGGGVQNSGTLTLIDSEVSSNLAEWFGAGVWNQLEATMAVRTSTFSDNAAYYGGGIMNGGTLSIADDSLVAGNSAEVGGGGIANLGELEVGDSTISENDASYGGGVQNQLGGNATIIATTITGNLARSWGGGIENEAEATMEIRASTISGNSAEGYDGGISNSGTLAVVNSTISGNSAWRIGGIGNWPGGIAVIGHSTVVANAATAAAGIYSDADTLLHHTLVAGNILGTVGDPVGNEDVYAYVPLDASSSFNLIGDAGSAGGLVHGANGNLVGQAGSGTLDVATILDTRLRNNGGPTFTHALVWGSPAIDAGDPEFDPHGFTPPMLDDQRGAGFARVRDGRLDIGAYEFRFNPWHHYADPYDVNGRDGARPLDVLELINFINLQDVLELPDPSTELSPPPYVDVNNDGLASAADVLSLINYLNALAAAAAEQPEGEFRSGASDPLALAGLLDLPLRPLPGAPPTAPSAAAPGQWPPRRAAPTIFDSTRTAEPLGSGRAEALAPPFRRMVGDAELQARAGLFDLDDLLADLAGDPQRARQAG